MANIKPKHIMEWSKKNDVPVDPVTDKESIADAIRNANRFIEEGISKDISINLACRITFFGEELDW